MKKSSKKKPTWTDLKRQLTDLDRPARLDLVQDLYAASRNNQAFLHARFALGGYVLEPYKTTIDRWVCPDVMSNQDISVAKAKKAISDYKKAIGRPEGLAELTVFYCESCMNLLGYCGMDDEGYFNALVCMFEKIGDSHRLNDPPFSHDRLRQTNDVSATVAETIKNI